MSPTLLESVVVVVLIIVAWQIGVLISPYVLRMLKQAIREVDQASKDATEIDPASTKKEETHVTKYEQH
jgi:hypothetical protein